jgi:hypothetical protein
MADRANAGPQSTPADLTRDPYDPALDAPLPNADDPGGAHRKGYSAEPGPAPKVKDTDPLPLAPDTGEHPQVRKPDEDPSLPPTGRDEPSGGSRVTRL